MMRMGQRHSLVALFLISTALQASSSFATPFAARSSILGIFPRREHRSRATKAGIPVGGSTSGSPVDPTVAVAASAGAESEGDNNQEASPAESTADSEAPPPMDETGSLQPSDAASTTMGTPAAAASVTSVTPLQSAGHSKLGPNAPPPGLLRRQFPAFPWHRLPDWLTYSRCVAIPLLVAMFYQPQANIATGWLFALASFTDWLDGYLARRWDISSAFGAFLDPVSDKLMVSTALILLAGRYGAIVAIPTAIILAREIAVSALREWMAQRGQRDAVKVGMQGKVKTALTMVSLTVLLFVPENNQGILAQLLTPGLAFLYLCALVTITSGSVYFIAAAPLLFDKEN